jgi:gliding motility-associated-like protein
MRKSYFFAFPVLVFFFLVSYKGIAQKQRLANPSTHTNWSVNPFDRKVFIENKGQFDNDVQTDGRILYETMLGKVKVYFTAKGIIYRCDSNYTLAKKDLEETNDDPREEGTIHTISRYAVMIWQNANPGVSVIAEQEEADYYTYYIDATKKTLIANAFKKLTYRNVYPGIDVEYTFPEKGGMEYTLLIHPGADAGKIKMKYTGAKLLALDEQKNLNIDIANSGVIDILDHAPVVFTKKDNTPISSSFSLNGEIVSFNLGHYKASDELVIDPWSINPLLTSQDVAFDVAKDLAGNVYVYGGGGAGSPWKVQKYTPGGALIWTYTTTFASWYGDLAVSGVGNTYITEGCCGGGIREISPSGVVHWSVNNGVYEYWLLSFDCSYTHLYLGCAYSAGAIPAESVSNIDTTNGVISGAVALPSGGSEPRDIAWAPNGNLYFLTVTAGNDVIGVTPAFAPLFSVGNGYAFLYNGPSYANGSNPTSAMNGIAAGKTFIATSDGATLMKRNINTGALISSIAIPGGVASGNSGVMIDGCGNIFVGSHTAVYEYDSLLNPITNVATAGAVYCLYPGSSGQVLACGVSFVASLNFPTSSNYSFTTAVTPAGCACNGTAKVTLKLCGITDTTNVTYLWNNGQTTQTATNLCAGNYTVTISLECSPNTYVDSVTILGGGGLALSTVQTNVKCFGATTGSATVTPTGGTAPYTYAWTPSGGSGATASNLTAGSYTVTVKDKNGCTGTASVTITQPAALTATTAVVNVKCFGAATGSITVTAGGGTPAYTYAWAPSGGSGATASNLTIGSYTATVTDANGCTVTASATITQPAALTVTTTTTGVKCSGGSTGSAFALCGGGNAPYTYSWAPMGGSNSLVSNLSAGCYTVTVTDANGCTATALACVTNPPALTATTTTTAAACGANNGSATVTPGGGTGAYTYSWAPSGGSGATASNLTAGNYTVTVTDANGCTVTAAAVVTSSGGVTANISASTNINCNGGSNGSATVTAGGGTPAYTYLWNPSAETTQTATGLTAGSYTVTVTDANGCTATASVTLTQPPALTATTTLVNVKCFGASTGSITVTPGGGIPAYTYAWAPSGGSGATASNLTIGTYTVTVTDANGCTKTASATITQPPVLTASTTTTIASCGANNGTATVTANGGTPAYTYAWTPSGGSGITASNLSVGNYTVTVTDANGCTVTASATITSSGSVTANITASVNISCNGGSNGSATVTPGGGTPAYTYLWNPSAETTQTATGLSAGSYTITVTDANGCTATASVTLTQPAAITAPTTTTPVLCNGGSIGSATVTPGGGTGAYTYSWAPSGGSGATASNLSANTYTVTVTDANGCSVTATATVTQPTALTATTAITAVLCNGGNTGTATVTPGGGTGAYTYSWAPSGGSGASASNLSAISYTVTVTDANGCTVTATANVTQPAALTASTTTTPAACGVNNGTATVTAGGGTGAYTYAWTPSGGSNATATSLSVGTYTVTVKDANGCSITATANITNAGGETATITASTNITCNGGNNGSATVTAVGGTAPYTYNWAPGGQTNATASNLTAGSYTVTVKDANGCTATASVILTQPTSLTAVTTTIAVKCNGSNNGSATVTAGGGTGAYTYAWTPSGGSNATASNLTAGTYTITVTDANGCTKTATAVITQPAAMTLTAAGFPTSCGGGSDGQATVIPAGGTPAYTYTWAPGGATSANATGLTAGTYTITVTDAKGCSQSATATVTQPAPIVVNFSADSLNSCAPLCVTFKDLSTDPGGTINKWSWDFGDGSAKSAAQNPKHCYSNPGLYSVTLTVTDNKGCTETLTVNNMIDVYSFPVAAFNLSPQPATIIDPTIRFTDKSTDAYGIATWYWNFHDPGNDYFSNAQNPAHTYSDTGVFCATLTVTNIHGCVDSVTECLIISPQYTLYIPDAFTPNGDHINNIFMPKGEYIQSYNMYIFDRWGMEIFHSTDMTKGWNGCVNGGSKICQEDTYVYSINITDNLGKKHNYIGKVTLIK